MPSEKDLFANFERMRREIDELFGDVFGRASLVRHSGFVPHVDVAYMGDPPTSVVIQAELAGVDPSRVALEIRGRRMVIAGERAATAARILPAASSCGIQRRPPPVGERFGAS